MNCSVADCLFHIHASYSKTKKCVVVGALNPQHICIGEQPKKSIPGSCIMWLHINVKSKVFLPGAFFVSFFFFFWFRGSVSVVEIFVFIFYYLMFFSTDGILEESGTPMAY
jgi:hypothetical protein